MPLFKKKPVIEGQLGYLGLGDWWLSTFTEKERDYIESVYHPMQIGSDNARPLTQGKILYTGLTAVSLVGGLAAWLHKPEDFSIVRRCFDKAESLSSPNILDKHFLYQTMIETYYKRREIDPTALDSAIAACKKQIAIAPQAAKAFKKEYPKSSLPAHVGYTQLSIILDKQKSYEESIRVCRQAKQQGWNGDWDKRIARYEEKLRKQTAEK